MGYFTCGYCGEEFPHWDDYIYHLEWECEKPLKKYQPNDEKYEL